jgi:hypothetical protein
MTRIAEKVYEIMSFREATKDRLVNELLRAYKGKPLQIDIDYYYRVISIKESSEKIDRPIIKIKTGHNHVVITFFPAKHVMWIADLVSEFLKSISEGKSLFFRYAQHGNIDATLYL